MHCVRKLKGSSLKQALTNALRRIRNAWHFCYALILVIKVVCRHTVLRCSPLKRALCNSGKFRGSIF
ncbi:DUF3265 domain-containing protein [Vibrio vulnificus]|nr:DUF3265 domain-containing protein [Vibrio vulnificus]EGR0799535.1 DUF3265 domain-containing protein [Vibrio vulnificus]EGR0816965.1 DUF3265 domain-containing protein [Vibrio vulnificus]EGR0829030.1 DUF3265 domain-containing protein [Vibrio vulnificus]EGR0849434.1 DUF3265 domain-containing protein [Vibrio vulnificus]